MATTFDAFGQLPPELRVKLDELANGTDAADLNDSAVTTVKINDLAVTTGKLAASAVTTAKIATAAVTAAKSLTFSSAELTATGASQNVAHGLAVAPSIVIVSITEISDAVIDANAGVDILEGTHTTTNVVVTVTANVKFKVFAWA